MGKRFKAKKRKTGKFKFLLYLFVIVAIIIIMNMIAKRFTLATTNEMFIENLLEDSNYYMKYQSIPSRVITDISHFFSSFQIEKPVTILEESLGYKMASSNEKKEDTVMIFKKNDVEDLQIPNTSQVYIYSTHYKEGYASNNLESYHITPNVNMAAMLLKEKLNKLGVETIVEEGDIGGFMAVQNWNHAKSYEASRYFVNDAITKYPNLKLIIDLHRDAVPKKASTTEIDGTSYAKILFVCGKENENYEKNLALMTKLNEKIKSKYPTITRGIMMRGGSGVNGVYNQDLNGNMILLECGGNENNIGEVTNTLSLLAPIIKEFLDEI